VFASTFLNFLCFSIIHYAELSFPDLNIFQDIPIWLAKSAIECRSWTKFGDVLKEDAKSKLTMVPSHHVRDAAADQ
jgi:hypothetical protein